MSVVVGRLVLLALSASALAAGIVLGRDSERAGTEQGSTARYMCPMHPEVVSPTPGDCPICGMALEPASGAQEVRSADAGLGNRIVDVERRMVTQVLRAPAWLADDGVVTAVVHADDLVAVAPGEQALFFPRTTPAAGRPVHLSSAPPAPWDASTVEVRFVMDGTATSTPSVGWLQLAARPRELLVVPESAVLYSGDGPYVLAAPHGGHTFTRRSVTIGRILDSGHVADLTAEDYGAVTVLSGLKEGERVVAGDTFFLDAERRLQASRGKPAEVVE